MRSFDEVQAFLAGHDTDDHNLASAFLFENVDGGRRRATRGEHRIHDEEVALVGVRREDAIGTSFLPTIHPDDAARVRREVEGMLADGPQSVITQQVTNGVAIRMAVLDRVARTMAAR